MHGNARAAARAIDTSRAGYNRDPHIEEEDRDLYITDDELEEEREAEDQDDEEEDDTEEDEEEERGGGTRKKKASRGGRHNKKARLEETPARVEVQAAAKAATEAAPVPLTSLSQDQFRNALITHFTYLWNNKQLVWPSRTGEMAPAR